MLVSMAGQSGVIGFNVQFEIIMKIELTQK